ncbi:MAG TPA: hypothetical protein VGO43_07660 [Pyrinomonadaceae bacterium]|jgi:hypothetical protein|nr:hypothetical protein [Pyrinomonadaceae bacterium]
MKRTGLTLFAALVLATVFALGASRMHAQTVFVACTWDTSSIFKDKAGKEKFERRFYVSPIVTVTADDFLKIDSSGDRIDGLCGDYLDKTVVKAATERGERLDPGGSLRVRRSIELSGEDIGSAHPYNFATRESIQKLIDADVKEMVDANRFVMNFGWDPTGKKEADDYANEKKRSLPTSPPKPTKP